MRPVDYIALSIPIFFALIGVEWLYARLRGERLYRLNDSIADLSTGVLDQVLGVFTKAITVGAYAWVWNRWRLDEWDASSPGTWILCFLGVDFLYYWFHRVSHERNLPWGAHIVHHSSEEYNLSVALRQGAFQSLWSFPFYLPLALLGFPPLVFLACSAFDTLYQFWIHTRAIGKLGPLEWVLNTPSHHRVHHGRDDKYIDKNYAGTFIVWDRLFGTFQGEEEEPQYGITKPLRAWNPLWANVHHYVDLARASKRAPNRREVARLWWNGPGFKPQWLSEETAAGAATVEYGYDARAPRGVGVYAVTQFVVVLLAATVFLFRAEALPWGGRVAGGLLVAWGVLNVGGLFDGRRWVLTSEPGRLFATFLAAGALLAATIPAPVPMLAAAILALAATGSMVWWFLALRSRVTVSVSSAVPVDNSSAS